MRVAIINVSTNKVENIALYAALPITNGVTCVESDTANIGDTWNGTSFIEQTVTPPTLTAAQEAAAALADGIVITSIGTPVLDGTYAVDQTAQNNVNATVTYILLNGTFPGHGTTMPWIDQNGDAHVWPSVTAFKTFATAFANYVAAVALYAASNGAAGSLPSNEITIA